MARSAAITIFGILLIFPATAQHGAGQFAQQARIIGGPVFDARVPIATFPRTGFARTTPVIIGPQDYSSYSPYSAPYPYFAPAPFYSTPIYYSEPSYISPPIVESPVVTHNDSYYETSVLNNQVQQLTQEVERLQQAVESQRPVAQASPAPRTPPTPTVLVFRDGRQTQILNYAIVGQTLWVLDQGATNKIPPSELDLNATQRENQARGIRFPSLQK